MLAETWFFSSVATSSWHCNFVSYRERNSHYAELCKSRKGNDKYVERLMQTFSGAKKEKQIQTDTIIMADEGRLVIQIQQ